jgi:hypothetical protein
MRSRPFDLTPIWGGCGERATLRATAKASGWPTAYFSVGEFAFARLMRAGETAAEALADALSAYPDSPSAAAVVRTFETHNGPGMIAA